MPSPLFGSSREEPTRSSRLPYVVIGVAIAGGVAGWRLLGASPPPAPPPEVPSAAEAPTAPRTPRTVPVPGALRNIPGGTFKMGGPGGDPDELPEKEVTVAPFELDETEVTVAAYGACVKAGKCTEPDRGGPCNWGVADRVDHPVNCVDHEQATAYCSFAERRLPREDEWEFAARGPDGRSFPWKDGAPGKQLCWNGDGNDLGRGKRASTCPVASYPEGASPFGVQDLAGDVWEWTASPYCPYDKPDCGDAHQVIRGGAWNNLVPAYVRARDRSKEGPKARNGNIGFRCAK